MALGGFACAGLAIALRSVATGLVLAGGLLAGAAAFLTAEARPSDLQPLDGTIQTFRGVVDEEPVARETALVFLLRLEARRERSRYVPARGRLRAYAYAPTPLRWGDRVEVTGRVVAFSLGTNPGEVPLRLRYGPQGVRGLLLVGSRSRVIRMGYERPPFHERAAAAARARVRATLRRSMPGPYGPLLAELLGSILFGLRSMPLPPALVDAFRRCGTLHILVVSGTQISLLFTVVWLPGALALMLQRRRAGGPWQGSMGRPAEPRPASLALILTLVGAYAVLAGGGNPVWRAAIMGCLLALGIALRHIPAIAEQHPLEPDRYTFIAAAALLLLIQRPAALLEPGFQLSFAAVLGLAYVSPRIAGLLRFLPKWLMWAIAFTAGAQLATMPITAWHFGDVSLMGFVANLVAVPLAAVLLVLGLSAAALGLVWPGAALAAGYPAAVILWWLVRATSLLSEMPGASIRYRPGSIWDVLAYYVVIAAAAWAAGRLAAARAQQPLAAQPA